MSNKESFNLQIDCFAKYFRVIAPDLTGFGESESMPYPYSLDDYVNSVKKLIDCLGVSEYDVIAHSFGARVAIKLAIADIRLKKLVLTGAAGIKPKRKFSYYVKIYSYKFLKKLFPKAEFKNFGSSEYKSLNSVMKKSYVKIVNEHLNGVLYKVKNKTLILSGSDDVETPPYTQKRLNKGINNSVLYFIKGAGHFAFVTAPYQFNFTAREFLLEGD